MARFLAVHNFGPGAREMFAQQSSAMLAALKESFPEVVWVGMYTNWDTGKTVCLWDAPDVEAVTTRFEQLQVPYDDIFSVDWVTPHDLASRT